MTATTQRELLSVLAEVWALAPDVRLGQLMSHLGFLGEDGVGRTLWDIDDEELLTVLKQHREELLARTVPSPMTVASGISNAYRASVEK